MPLVCIEDEFTDNRDMMRIEDMQKFFKELSK